MFWWAFGRSMPKTGFTNACRIGWKFARSKSRIYSMTRQLERTFDRLYGLSA